jgi:2-dehydro-3-deoxygluconokinase
VAFERIIGSADIVSGGDDELTFVVGEAAAVQQLAERINALGPRQVIVKLGADGCAALVEGLAGGAFACLVPGDREGMPRRSEFRMLSAADPFGDDFRPYGSQTTQNDNQFAQKLGITRIRLAH